MSDPFIDPYDLIRDDLAKIQKYRELKQRLWEAEVTVNETDKQAILEELGEAEPEAKEVAARFATMQEGGGLDG